LFLAVAMRSTAPKKKALSQLHGYR
jgi:hypothetical protein